MSASIVSGDERAKALAVVRENHYSHSIPSGKTHVVIFEDAVILFSIPANRNAAGFIGVESVWELSRLWAPNGHGPNLLTRAISDAVRLFKKTEPGVDALISYADPNVGHSGGVYRAASWIYDGQSEEGRYYRRILDGQVVARRAFHSGSTGLRKAQILALGYEELKMPGKHRFLFPLSRQARKILAKREREASRRG